MQKVAARASADGSEVSGAEQVRRATRALNTQHQTALFRRVRRAQISNAALPRLIDWKVSAMPLSRSSLRYSFWKFIVRARRQEDWEKHS